MHTISVDEVKTHFDKVLNQVETGEEIVITRLGEPIARISGIDMVLKPVPSMASLRATLPFSETPSVEMIRQMRDEEN